MLIHIYLIMSIKGHTWVYLSIMNIEPYPNFTQFTSLMSLTQFTNTATKLKLIYLYRVITQIRKMNNLLIKLVVKVNYYILTIHSISHNGDKIGGLFYNKLAMHKRNVYFSDPIICFR